MVERMHRLSREAAATIFVLTAINFLNFIDRYVLSAVVEGVSTDFALSDTGAGLLGSMFIVVYTLASPFVGFFGDRVVRKYIVAAGVALWSLATTAGGLAPGFEHLLASRALVGIGEAAYATVAPAIIADLCTEERRGRVLAWFYLAVPVGSALGFVLGGLVSSQAESVLALVGLAGRGIAGWRVAFFVAGVPGLVLAAIVPFVHEPRRGASDSHEDRRETFGVPAALRRLVSTPAFRINTVGITLMTFSLGGLAFWMPSFLQRVHGMDEGSAGVTFGAITVVAGLSATLLGGYLGDRAQRSSQGGYFRLSGIGLVLGAPCALAVVMAPNLGFVFAFAFLAEFFLFLNTGPLNAALVGSVPAGLRATAVALNVLCTHAFGDAVSPPIMGAISDLVERSSGDEMLGLRVAVGITAIPLALGGLVLLVGSRRVAALPNGLRTVDGARPPPSRKSGESKEQ